MLKMNEIKEWDEKLLTSKVSELKKEYFELRMQKGVSGLEKPHRLKEIKRDVARLKTVLSSKGGK